MGLFSILAPLIVFGLVIFVHELGHFLAAKWTGVYAPRFSVGFGPALWRRRFGETEYVLAALPLGGYVRMASKLDEEASSLEGGSEESSAKKEGDPGYDPEAMIPFGPKKVPEDRWFESKPLWQRLVILLAGVTMNVILTLVVSIGLAFYLGRSVLPTTVVGAVRPVATAPALAQLQVGDTIRSVNGARVETWTDVARAIVESPAPTLSIVTGTRTVTVDVGPGRARREEVARALDPLIPPVIDSVLPEFPAAAAGLQAGDSIVSLNGVPVRSWTEMLDTVSAYGGKPLRVEVARASGRQVLTVTPKPTEIPDPETGAVKTLGRVGATPRDISRQEPVGALEAVGAGWDATWAMGGQIVRVVKGLATREVSVKNLGGPIAITRASVAAARNGLENLLYLIAFLSINVAILNLLPIPILDGGQVVLNVLESIKGSPFSMRTREYILRFGLVAIGMLFALVMFNDIRDGVMRLLK
ncbi:MAG TPA: RIP metalloprotease RseP [Gemmatimonadaceae bacterium]